MLQQISNLWTTTYFSARGTLEIFKKLKVPSSSLFEQVINNLLLGHTRSREQGLGSQLIVSSSRTVNPWNRTFWSGELFWSGTFLYITTYYIHLF